MGHTVCIRLETHLHMGQDPGPQAQQAQHGSDKGRHVMPAYQRGAQHLSCNAAYKQVLSSLSQRGGTKLPTAPRQHISPGWQLQPEPMLPFGPGQCHQPGRKGGTAVVWWEFSPTSLAERAQHLFISCAAAQVLGSSLICRHYTCLPLSLPCWAYWACGPASWPMCRWVSSRMQTVWPIRRHFFIFSSIFLFCFLHYFFSFVFLLYFLILFCFQFQKKYELSVSAISFQI